MSPKKIYLIDDDIVFHYMIEKALKNINKEYKLEIFKNGKTAIDTLRVDVIKSNFPELIILDLYMPEMDGWQFLELFKTLNTTFRSQIHVYMVSASQDLSTLKRAKGNQELSGFFTKPIGQAEINMIVEESPKDYWDPLRILQSIGNNREKLQRLGIY